MKLKELIRKLNAIADHYDHNMEVKVIDIGIGFRVIHDIYFNDEKNEVIIR